MNHAKRGNVGVGRLLPDVLEWRRQTHPPLGVGLHMGNDCRVGQGRV
jgi:hypothetical protein